MPFTVTWIHWTVLNLAWVICFAVLEGNALAGKSLTLSRFTYNISVAWPPFIWLAGVVCGGLAVHFWWSWSPRAVNVMGGPGGG